MSEPIVGTGPKGEPVTARQRFLLELEAVRAEWKLQEEMTDEEYKRIENDLGPRAAFSYLAARLDGHLKGLYLAALRLPPELWSIPLTDTADQSPPGSAT
jgi:hypothetical protein